VESVHRSCIQIYCPSNVDVEDIKGDDEQCRGGVDA
jgi:hypothetical protein